MKALLLFLLFSSQALAGPAIIFSGSNVKTLKPNYDLNGSSSIMSGTTDPTSVAVSAPAGSIYLNTSSGNVYKKNDAGSTTNWSQFTTASSSGQLIVDGYFPPIGTCLMSRASGTLGSFNGGLLTTCAAFTVEANPNSYTITGAAQQNQEITVNSLPAGTYEVDVYINGAATTGKAVFLAVFDGTNSHGVTSYTEYQSIALQKVVRAYFEYGSSGNHTFSIYSAEEASFGVNQQTNVNGGGPVRITVKRWQ